MKKKSGATAKAAPKRIAGALTLSPGLAEMLGALRAAKKIATRPEAMVRDVIAAEKAIRGELPNDLLGVWIATGGSLGGLVDWTNGIREYYRASDDRSSRDIANEFAYVCIDDSEERADEGWHCAKLGNDAPAQIVFWMARKADAWEPSFDIAPGEPHFAAFLRWKYPDVDFGTKAEPVTVTLIDAAPAKSRRLVTHPKFGEGVVVTEIAPDKVEVDFGPPTGVKKLIRWFE